ncbi:MAG: hypothetical protein SWE60_02520 [Thermodesulfobacteriota bacterium]|nr:hypothetical protein [Thermodesulfobacteriota bacterium]
MGPLEAPRITFNEPVCGAFFCAVPAGIAFRSQWGGIAIVREGGRIDLNQFDLRGNQKGEKAR